MTEGTGDLPEPPVRALAWMGDDASGHLRLLDQTRLPAEEVWLDRDDDEAVVDDIRRLAVRGAPAIGVAGAYALVLAARRGLRDDSDAPRFRARLLERAGRVASARPTAVNLSRAVDEVLAEARALERPPTEVPEAVLAAARRLERGEAEASAAIARHGARWLAGRSRVLTHCNAGALVTPGLGTALAPLYLLHARGERVFVWVDETRPLLQGLRLTAWELRRAGIDHRVLVDGAAATLLGRGEVDAVLVGADRVCRNGDVVNKVGTYPLALAARRHGVPFGVAAPISTLDPLTASGADVEIEERPGDEAVYLGSGTAPAGVRSFAPAFDVTPADLVSALVTDRGVLEAPSGPALGAWMEAARHLQSPPRGGR